MTDTAARARALIASHQPNALRRAVELLLQELECQGAMIVDLRTSLTNQHERHSNQVADLRKQIDHLKKVHGA